MAESNVITASTEETIRPLIGKNVVIKKFLSRKKRGDLWLIGDKDVDKYVIIPESKVDIVTIILQYFDGTYTLKEVKDLMLTHHHVNVDVNGLYQKLLKAGLIANTPQYGRSFSEADLLKNIITINPSKLLWPLEKIINKYWRAWKLVTITSVLVSVLGWIWLLVMTSRNQHFRYVSMSYIFGFQDSFFLGFVLAQAFTLLSSLLHELGHYIMARHLNLESKGISFSFYGSMLPMLKVDARHVYLLEESRRMHFWLSGIYVNLLLASLSFNMILLANLTNMNANFLVALLWKIVLVNLFLVIINLIPFLPSDGYFVFSTLLKHPNLRTKMIKTLLTRKIQDLSLVFWVYSLISMVFLTLGLIFYVNWIFFAAVELFKVLPLPTPLKYIVVGLIPVFFFFQLYNGVKIIRNFYKNQAERVF